MRLTKKWVLGSIAAAALAVFLTPAFGGGGPAQTVSLDGGTGMAGGTANVVISLSGDDAGAAVSLGVDVAFSTDDLNIVEPVMTGCQIDDRLSSTHLVGGRVLSPGVAAVEVIVLGTPDPPPPLGNGPIASCAFAIDSGALVGDMYPVGATNVLLGDAAGAEIPSSAVDGVVEIVGDPTPTPTDTPTVAPTVTPPAECTTMRDCPSGQDCVDDRCVPIDCRDDEDCPPGNQCVFPLDAITSGTGEQGVCQPRPCTEDSDCQDPQAICVDGMCTPQYCDDPSMCDPGETCENELCTPECEDDSECPDGVCVGNTCVGCRADSDCEPNETCTDNTCTPIVDGFGLAVGSVSGEAGTSVSVPVTLTGGSAADSVTNSLAAASGLTLTACAAVDGITASFDGLPGSTASAQLGDGEASVPTGVVYECTVSIAESATGNLPIECPSATANGSDIACSAGGVSVVVPPTPTATFTSTPTATFTQTPQPTDPPRRSGEDDGCAVGPVTQTASPFGSFALLMVPAVLVWRRRRA